MGRRVTKAESKGILALIIIGLPIFVATKIYEAVGWVIPVAIIIGVVVLGLWYQASQAQKRIAYLREKYQNEDVVQKILKRMIWHGQSEEQLRDSLGDPADVDHKFMKTKTRDVWKYDHQGANRYGLRITVEDGYVAGWDKKN